MHPDEGYKNFEKIYEEYKDKLNLFNEAETRAKIIDQILKECLGWSERTIRREDNVDIGYTDYQLLNENVCVLVIEAKKSGEYFNIPETMTSRNYKLSGAISGVNNLMNALKQARAYCSEIGCRWAAVFNGHQLIVFTALVIGKSWKAGHCVVFNSLDDIKNNFELFWNMLAYEHVIKGSLINYLEKGKRDLVFEKIIADIHNPDKCWARNELYTYIRPISDFVFSELLDERRAEVLRECYVFGRTSTPLTREMEDYFIDKLPYFAEQFKIKDIIEREVKARLFERELDKQFTDESKGSLVVLLGGIGAGKSTFLHRFFKIVLEDRENLIWLYIDFKFAPTSKSEIENYILTQMVNEWDAKYALKLSSILEEVGFNVDKDDPKNYLKKLIKLLRVLKFSITIIIDNVDRHDFNFQEKIFLSSQHLTDIFKTVTIVALREETFLSSTRTGVFDAYDVPKFHIASPNFLDMILIRIDFTLKLLGHDSIHHLLPRIDENDLASLKKYFSIIKSSLLRRNKQSRKIVKFIDNISVGNMREALRMFNNFIVSGNTNIKEIFDKHAESGSYQIAYHQFIKSIILGEYQYYMQNRSQVMNIFDFDSSLTDSHLNLLRVLHYLLDRENKKSSLGQRGYILIDELFTAADLLFISKDVIRDSLLRLSSYNLVEYDNQSRDDIDTASFVKITPAGKYYLNYLIYEFVYLDSIILDTPLSDMNTLRFLKTVSNETDLQMRLEKTKRFVEYLHKSEEAEFKAHPEYLFNEFTNTMFAHNIAERFKGSAETIRTESIIRAVKKNRGQ